MKNFFKKAVALAIVSVLSVGILTACAGDDQDGAGSKGTVNLGYVNWSEGIAMTNLAAAILEDEMGYKVDMTLADVAPIFTSLSSGNTDAFLDAWLPTTHASYMERYGDDLDDLGFNYENARLGLVVPEYVDINSIEELNDKKGDFNGEIVGIDSGAGVMLNTESAIEQYELDFELIPGSGPTMTAALKKAIDAKEPIVVTGWSPHWKFSRWDLKILDDPKNVYGDAEHVHTIARKGLADDMPEVAEFLKNFKMTDEELSSLMEIIEDNIDDDPIISAREWMKDNKDSYTSWIPTTEE